MNDARITEFGVAILILPLAVVRRLELARFEAIDRVLEWFPRVDLRVEILIALPRTAAGCLRPALMAVTIALVVFALLYLLRWETRTRVRVVRDLAESLPDMVWTCSSDGRCDYLSPQWVTYTGISEAAQLGYGWLAQLHPEDLELTRARWAACVASGAPLDIEFRIRRHDGVHRWFKTRAVPVLDADRRITKWFGSNTDVQDLRDAQEATVNLNRELEAHVLARTEELRNANHKLESLAEQLQIAQRVAQVGSGELEVATGRVTWSEELYRIMGRDPSEPLPSFDGQAPMFSTESWQRIVATVKRCLVTGEGAEDEFEVVGSNGTRRTILARTEVVKDAEGRPERVVATCQDVTERERVREQLHELTERLQLATSAARMGVWDWNLVDNVHVWDAKMYELYDTPPELIGNVEQAWIAAAHPEDRHKMETAIHGVLNGDRDFDVNFRIVRSNGEVRHLNSRAFVRRDPSTGQVLRIVGINRDVTERRVAEQALRSSEVLQRAILAQAGSGIIGADLSGTITLFNQAAEAMLGYRASEVVGVTSPAIIHDRTEVEARRAVLEQELGVTITDPFEVFVIKARSGQADTNEWTYIRKDGSRFPVLLTVSTVRDDANEIVAYLGVAMDLSRQKQHEAELHDLNRLLAERTEQAESASQAKSMFLANMSHEIRTPMGAITGVTYLLGRTPLSAEQSELVQTIERSTKTLLGMINDILDLSKIEARQLTLDIARFRLTQVLDELVGLMTAYASGKDLALVLDAHEEMPDQLVGDRVRLIQVLTNLAGNAIKFTEHGTVRVSVRCCSQDDDKVWLRFDVADDGPGMDEELLAKLFTPFTQADGPRTRRVGGTGLGLAIVKQLVTLMGGHIGVTSVVGMGSRFWCLIPFGRPATDERDATERLKVLVVDDDVDQRLSVVASARRLGWRVEAVGSGEEGLSTIIEHEQQGSPFDAVILDWRMPMMDGLQTLAAARHALGERGLPSVVMTTAADLDLLRQHTEVRLADALLAKPFTASGLFDAMAKAVTTRTGSSERLGLGIPYTQIGQRLPGVRLLVVDDSEVNRSIAARILELEGAQIVLAVHGGEAVDRVLHDEHGFDAVLMDIQMPEVDGVEASRRIRQHVTSGELPIIALTAGALSSERQQALEAGMNDFISKPFVVDALIASVRRHVERTRGTSLGIVSRPKVLDRPRQWPMVDGIDPDDAHARLDGDSRLFLNMLARLLSELEELQRLVVEAPDTGAVPDFPARVHKLRGMAGNLGARDLHRAAGEADVALLPGGSSNERRVIVHRFLVEVDRLRHSLRMVLHVPAADTEAANPRAEPVDPVAWTTFVSALRQQNFAALTLFAELSPSLESRLGAAAHGRLRQAMDALDFAAALDIVTTVIEAPVE